MTQSAIVLGATGAVGSQVVKALLDSPAFPRVTTLGRRPVEGFSSAKLAQHSADIFAPASYEASLAGHDTAFCTLGVGEPSKMSKAEFRRIDVEAAADFATACKRAGVKHFTLLTSVGANAKSPSFYLRSKGELEERVRALGFERSSFFRPSMILTPKNRYGLSQAVILKVWPWMSGILWGPLRRYRGVRVEDLGGAMVRNAERMGSGVEILEWPEFRKVLRP